MTAPAPGWYPDPSGRYALRYYDGTTWTAHVQDAAGATTTDPVPTAPPVPPQQQQPYSPYTPPPGYAPAPGYGAYAPVAPNDYRGMRIAGTIIAGVGLLFVAIGVLADLDWFTLEDFDQGITLGDIRDSTDNEGAELTAGFADGGWIAVLLVSALAVAGAWLRGPLRWIGLGAAILALAYTLGAIRDATEEFEGLELGGGAALTAVGLIAAIVGTALSRAPRKAPPGYAAGPYTGPPQFS